MDAACFGCLQRLHLPRPASFKARSGARTSVSELLDARVTTLDVLAGYLCAGTIRSAFSVSENIFVRYRVAEEDVRPQPPRHVEFQS
jgi:hypothetical protein